MERQALEVTPREPGKKGAARRLRAAGSVPAILYGGGMDPVALAVEGHLLDRALHAGANAILDLSGVAELAGKLALVKSLQRDPVSRRIVHCDLYAIDVKKKVTVGVPLHFEGKPKGVEMGGVLEPILRELEVECLPLEIPGVIAVDVSALEIGDSIHVRDLVVPAAAEVLTEMDSTVIHVVAPRVEEEPVAEEAEVPLAEGEEPPPAVEGAPAAEGAPATGEAATEEAKPEGSGKK